MNAYELAKAQQAYAPPTLEEIIKQQADRIAELEKAIKEAVESAECEVNGGGVDWYAYAKEWKEILKTSTTPQTKPLSDEEIGEIALKVQSGFFPHDDTLAFARAIEERILGK